MFVFVLPPDCSELLPGESVDLGAVRYHPSGVPVRKVAGDGFERGALESLPQTLQARLRLGFPLRCRERTDAEGQSLAFSASRCVFKSKRRPGVSC